MTRVFLTGASGFIAKHVLRTLLEAGHTVTASVRSAERKAEIEALFPDADLRFAFLDLASDTGWTEAMEGCEALIHTASPFPIEEPRDRDALIRPAVDGTRRALGAARAAGVGRVVLTSSNAAIYKDAAKPPDAPSDESNWTTPDAPFVTAYESSKTLAERAAWEFVANAPEMTLTTINPALVLGPPMDARYGASLSLVERLIQGRDPMAPPFDIGIVDVRDVATLHVAALDLEAARGKRFSANAGMVRFSDLARMLRDWDPSITAPVREAPVWLLRVMALGMPEIRTVLKSTGRNLDVPGTWTEQIFGMRFTSPRDALIASAEAIRRFG